MLPGIVLALPGPGLSRRPGDRYDGGHLPALPPPMPLTGAALGVKGSIPHRGRHQRLRCGAAAGLLPAADAGRAGRRGEGGAGRSGDTGHGCSQGWSGACPNALWASFSDSATTVLAERRWTQAMAEASTSQVLWLLFAFIPFGGISADR